MKVVDLADEFGLTTSEAIDACLWAGVPADSSATELTEDDAQRVRGLISGWIDAGFVPWRSQDEQLPGTASGPARAKGAAGGEPSPAPARNDGSTTTLEPPPAVEGDGAGATGAAAAVTEAPPTRDPAADPVAAPKAAVEPVVRESGLSATAPPPRGPLLPPAQGGPTGWLPGGPDAHPRIAPLAVIALALAISSLVIPFVTAILAIVLASVAKDRIESSRGWQKGENLATTAQIVAGVGVGLWLVLTVAELMVLRQIDTEDARDVQVELATVGYSDVHVGDCVRLPRRGDMTSWKTVNCNEPHQAQVVGSLDVSNALGLNYPGDQPIVATAKADCRTKLNSGMVDPSESGSLELGFAYPSSQTWKQENDRTIWCVAFRKDGTLSSQVWVTTTTSTTVIR